MPGGANLAAQLEAVRIRQANVENNYRELSGGKVVGHTSTLSQPAEGKPLGGKPLRNRTANADIILNQQDHVAASPVVGNATTIWQPPSSRFSAWMAPPCCSTTQRASARPSPVPPRNRPASA